MNTPSTPSTTSRNALREAQSALGATLSEVVYGESADRSAPKSLPTSFGNDSEAIAAAQNGVALYDCSHWGRIEVSDGDRLRFLHNQSTNDFMTLQPGQGCDTVFVTSTARTIDLATAFATEESVLLLSSPGSNDRLIKWMDRFIFFADKVKLTDLTDSTAAFTLIGPNSAALLSKIGAGDWAEQSPGSHQSIEIQGIAVRVAVASGLASPGYTLITAADRGAELWTLLAATEAVPLGETAWEQLRIEQGRPLPGQELTDDYNPLEAGLWGAVSFSKGCYIGQETIARLDAYNGVKQNLWGIRLSTFAEPGTVVMAGDAKVGRLTSAYTSPDGIIGLAYIRTKAGGAGLAVTVGEANGEVIEVPFLKRSRLA
ncbi:MAG: hypothetical protein WBA57_11240 [Elainellaceae cyanobacterium]